MAKFKVNVTYQGCVDILVDADNEESAKAEAVLAFEDVSAVEIEANIFDVSVASAYETDEEDKNDT